MMPWCTSIALLAALALGGESEWKTIEAPLRLEFPADHGRHDACRTEWWYATGIVEDAQDGARFGWQLTVFRRGIAFGPRAGGDTLLAARQVYAGHFVLIDLQSGKLHLAERVRREFPELAQASSTTLDVALEGWSFELGANGRIRARASDREQRMSIDVELAPSKPLVLHGEGGVSTKGPERGNASAYASWTRLATSGTLEIDGRARTVRGEAWFDHEWGSAQLGANVAGWDWFGLRLDDGRELMLYQLRRTDGTLMAESSGTLVLADGTARHVTQSEFTLVPESTWTSPKTKATYASAWKLTLSSAGIVARIRTVTPDCEIDARGSTGNVYWEGPVSVEGSVRGAGYGELTGYAAAMGGKL